MPATRTRTAKPADETGAPPVEAPAVPDFTTSKPPTEERRELFRIDGEPFTVPKVIDQRYVYLAANLVRNAGGLIAAISLVELLLGAEQFARLNELYESRRLTDDQLKQINDMVSEPLFARFRGEDTEGKD